MKTDLQPHKTAPSPPLRLSERTSNNLTLPTNRVNVQTVLSPKHTTLDTTLLSSITDSLPVFANPHHLPAVSDPPTPSILASSMTDTDESSQFDEGEYDSDQSLVYEDDEDEEMEDSQFWDEEDTGEEPANEINPPQSEVILHDNNTTRQRVMTAADIIDEQKKAAAHVAELTALETWKAELMLWKDDWRVDHVITKYMDLGDKALEDAGASFPAKDTVFEIGKASPDFMCFLCCDDEKTKTFALACGHECCTDCYSQYLAGKILENSSTEITCPMNCKEIVPQPAINLLVDERTKAKYQSTLCARYVRAHNDIKWCPAPDCGKAVEAHVPFSDESTIPIGECACGKQFCLSCNIDEDHLPCPCKVAARWLDKLRDESETLTWMSVHTKPCPKCTNPIEKNGGCNHIHCTQCKNHFCWVCLGDWAKHGSQNYQCNMYSPEQAEKEQKSVSEKRELLDRYMFFYTRYNNHRDSAKLDEKTYNNIIKNMETLQREGKMTWLESRFLPSSFEVLRMSRQTLLWTYAFAFFLDSQPERDIFLKNQEDLEFHTEGLSELFEYKWDRIPEAKVQFLDKCSYLKSRRQRLVDHVLTSLEERKWKFLS